MTGINNGQQWTTKDTNGHKWTTMDNNGQQIRYGTACIFKIMGSSWAIKDEAMQYNCICWHDDRFLLQ